MVHPIRTVAHASGIDRGSSVCQPALAGKADGVIAALFATLLRSTLVLVEAFDSALIEMEGDEVGPAEDRQRSTCSNVYSLIRNSQYIAIKC